MALQLNFLPMHPAASKDLKGLIHRIAANDPKLTQVSFEGHQLGNKLELLEILSRGLELNTNLEILNLSHNKIKDKGAKHIFHIITTNKCITDLDISFNHFSTVSINKMIPLMTNNISISHIQVKELTKKSNVFKKGSEINAAIDVLAHSLESCANQNQQLQLCIKNISDQLFLPSRNFKLIPPVIFDMSSLRELNLSRNVLTEIPSALYQLQHLRMLDISNNFIRHIDVQGIIKMKELRKLKLENNLLSVLPFSFALLDLSSLLIPQNLFASYYSLPYYTMQDKGIKIRVKDKSTRVSPREDIMYTRLWIIGDKKSGVADLVSLLDANQVFQTSQKILSVQEKTIIGASYMSRCSYKKPITFRDWFPTVNESSSETNITRKGGAIKHGSMTPRDGLRKRAFSFRHTESDSKDYTPTRDSGKRTPPTETSPVTSTSSAGAIMNNRRTKDKNSLSHRFSGFLSSRSNSSYITTTLNKFCHVNCWTANEQFSQVCRIFLTGALNSVPVLFAFNFTVEGGTMFAKISKFVHSYRPVDLFLVGTYEKAFDKMKKMRKQLRKKLEEAFPDLKFGLVLICTSSGRGVKILEELLMKQFLATSNDNLPFPFLANICSEEWYSDVKNSLHKLREHLLIKNEQIQELEITNQPMAAILPWDHFVATASQFDIKLEHCEQTAIFLRHIGVIYHFRDAKLPNECESLKNFVFLDPAIMFKCYDRMIKEYECSGLPLHYQSALHGAATDEISSVWKFMDIEMQKNIWKLFEHHGLVHKINKGNFIVPSKFEGIPNDIVMNSPPKWNGESSYVGRCYLFTIMNDLCFCKLVSALHLFVTEVVEQKNKSLHLVHVYQDMLELELRSRGKEASVLGVCRITYDYEHNRVLLFVCEDDPTNSLFCMMAEELDQIFSSDDSFVPTETPVLVICVCDNCQTMSIDEASLLPLEQIEQVASEGHAFFYCSENAVRIDQVAPDVALTNLQHMTVEYADVEIIKKVGEGAFATVFRGRHKEREVAVKKLDKNDSLSESFPEFRKEVLLMAGLQHPNTVGLLGLCMQPLCVLTEFCAHGDLFSYIASRRERKLPLPVDYIMDVLVDIASGMRFLHTAMPAIVHRDLKSPNILLCRISPDENPSSYDSSPVHSETAKVADFGLSMRTRSAVTERVVDNPIWLAPELLAKQPYSTASDVYAFGIIANELFSLDLPFHDCEYSFMHQLEDKIMNGTRPTIPKTISEEMQELIESCWHQNTEKRPKFRDITTTLENFRSNDSPSADPETREGEHRISNTRNRAKSFNNTLDLDDFVSPL